MCLIAEALSDPRGSVIDRYLTESLRLVSAPTSLPICPTRVPEGPLGPGPGLRHGLTKRPEPSGLKRLI